MDDLKSTPPNLPQKSPLGKISDQAVDKPFDKGVQIPPPPPTPPLTPPPEPIPPPPPLKEKKTEPSYPSPPPKKSSKRKLAATIALVILIVALGGISIATSWKLRQVEKVTPEEAEAWVGNHCTADCEIVVGPGKFSFVAGGHGMRDVKNATIPLTIPAGAQGHKAYAFWSGSGEWPYNDTTIKVNGQNVNAVKVFNSKDPKVGNSQIANLGKIPDGLVKGKTGKIDFQVRGLDNLNSDGRPGSGHGIGIILIYTGDNVGNSKIIFRLWGEWLLRASAAFDSGTGGNKSAVMQLNLSDLDATRSSDNKFAFFFGEGEKYRELCQDADNGGRLRPNHLWYQTTGEWKRLDANTGIPHHPWPACPLPENRQPGHWWATRITGRDLPSIGLSGNIIKFTADSLVREEGGTFGESYTFVGAVAQYPVAVPTLTPTPTPTPGPLTCINLGGEPEPLSPGEEITLTCTGSSDTALPIDHFEFRVSSDSGTPVLLPTVAATKTNGEWEGATIYEIPDYACYDIECRACRSSDSSECTDWGQAE